MTKNKVNKNQERQRSKRVKRGYGKRLISLLLAFLLSVKDKAGTRLTVTAKNM
jgi:hypothetical protein